MNEHSLKVLEFPKIISLIGGKCLTPYGKNQVESINPLFDRSQIERKQDEVSQMKDIINFGDPFPLCRMDDCREQLRKSQVEEMFLEPKEMLLVLSLVRASIEINGYAGKGCEKFPLIGEYLGKTRAFPELRTEIETAVDDEGEIKDTASTRLRDIRREIAESKRRIIARLEQIQSKHPRQPGWQDDIVTQRNDRYVIGVPSNRYRSDIGILHDRSQSGATLYVEPQETVELNNRINLLHQEERQEMIRILRAITSEIATRAEPLLENCRLIGILDAIHACAQFSNLINGNRPVITDEPSFDLVNSRHPLLIVQFGSLEKVVPIRISIDDARQAILVTGPNTGGKTVTLKTVGLSILMAQSGLHISADEKSEVGVFENLYADIGDEQSIELSLSTFSSHIKNIIQGLSGAAKNVLLLFDEIGAGTDPKEGSALAEAIVLFALEKGARMVATTHYSQLKTLATEYPQIENASLDFDRETLAPTYVLRLGIPGSSYAVEIAGRLGMPESICNRASGLVGSGERSVDNLIASLEAELTEIKKDKADLNERLERAKELESYYGTQTDRLKTGIESEKRKALADTLSYLDDTRRNIEKLVADIRRSQASKQAVKEFHRKLKQSEKKIRSLREELEPGQVDLSVFEEGDTVEIISFGQMGEIERLIGRDKARVKVGNVFTTVDLRNLRKIDRPAESKGTRPGSRSHFETEESVSREIHLRGMTAEEAVEKLDKFLDQAIVTGLTQVYVVHGKGTGILRRSLTEYLKNHPEVRSLRLGDWNEGGAGVTVVRLKE